MGESNRDVLWSKLWGAYVPLPQHEKTDKTMVVTGENDPLPTREISSDIMKPVDIQARYSKTIQTHTAVSVAPTNGYSDSGFIDTEGFNEIALNLSNDAATASSMHALWSSDGVNTQGADWSIISGTQQQKSISIPTKLRYCKIRILNTDAAAHTMSAWAYLKA